MRQLLLRFRVQPVSQQWVMACFAESIVRTIVADLSDTSHDVERTRAPYGNVL
jgi:hypothetical protein